jgi:hypothetical protein
VIPALALKPIGAALKAVPWQVYAGIALVIAGLYLRSHWIGVGVDRCRAAQEKAQAAVMAEAAAQEKDAPGVAQEAQAAVKPVVVERVRIIREAIKPIPGCDYPDSVQAVIREAAAAAD